MIPKPANWDSVESASSGFKKMVPGGYVCIIKKVTDYPSQEYFEVEYDVAEGPLKGIAVEEYEKWGSWGYTFRVYYRSTSMKFLKSFVNAVEKTNHGYVFDWNVTSLVGKGVGLVIGTRQYYNASNELKEVNKDVQNYCTAEEIRNGKFPQPTVRKPKANAAPAAAPVTTVPQDFIEVPNEEGLPF